MNEQKLHGTGEQDKGTSAKQGNVRKTVTYLVVLAAPGDTCTPAPLVVCCCTRCGIVTVVVTATVCGHTVFARDRL